MNGSLQPTEALLFCVLVQMIVMIGCARLGNRLFRRLGQPGVVGEILAGLALGPSLFGHFFPVAAETLFGAQAAVPITIISQLGLILLMFQIGMDFEFGHLSMRRNLRAVAAVTLASVAVPFVLGLAIGHQSHAQLAPGIDAAKYSLFCGVGLSITAVPILGRILREYRLTRSELGVVAICAAALNDVVGWVLLAGVSAYALARFSGTQVLLQLAGLAALVVFLWFVAQPLVSRILARALPGDGTVPAGLMAAVLCLIFAAGICTYRLGIFAIFGGFAAGLLFHRHAGFVRAWHHQVGRFVLVFFLPVFFTFTGLRTNVLGLDRAAEGGWLVVVILAATLGKILPVYAAARLSGFDPVRGWILGSLMNTRGLMELVVLNIGLDLGFIPPRVFTMLVIMAIVTTMMTGPLLKVLLPRAGHQVADTMDA